MPSKTFVPAFKAHVGEWEYYLSLMSYAQVAREISFAYEFGGNQSLATMIQRGIGDRTKEITNYLLTNKHRFLGSLVVAAWGGHPEYIEVDMDDTAEQGMLSGLDRNFGVLTFDGTQQFFALDGQHRLRAIKDAIHQNPELGSEDIGVIVVPHFDNDKGRVATRRLFSNINKNAVKTNVQENIALDEDDAFAIITRRLLDEHEFLKQDGVVMVFRTQGTEGDIKLATRAVPVSGAAWTTIGVLYDIVKGLGYDRPKIMQEGTERPSDELLDESYDILVKRLDDLLVAAGDIRAKYLAAPSPKELRAPKGHEGDGHPYMRPVVQVQTVRALCQVLEQNLLGWDEALKRLGELDWRLAAPPFLSVWTETPDGKSKGRMATAKENAKALHDLLCVHLAPRNKAEIDRAIKAYRTLKNKNYPVKAEVLAGHISTPSAPPAAPEEADPAPPEQPAPVVDDVDDIADVEPGEAEPI